MVKKQKYIWKARAHKIKGKPWRWVAISPRRRIYFPDKKGRSVGICKPKGKRWSDAEGKALGFRSAIKKKPKKR